MKFDALKFLSKDPETLKHVKSFIKSYMREENIKSKDLATQIKVSESYISQVLGYDDERFSFTAFAKIMEALNIPVTCLIREPLNQYDSNNHVLTQMTNTLASEVEKLKKFIDKTIISETTL